MKYIILLFLLFQLACSNNDENPLVNENESDRFELLTNSKGWKLNSSTISPAYPINDTLKVVDGLLLGLECNNDNILFFNSDSTYEVMEGLTKCDSADPELKYSGSWELNDDQTQIITRVDSGSRIEVFEIASVRENEFTTNVNFTEEGIDYSVVSVWTNP